jgi:hypothetical protein
LAAPIAALRHGLQSRQAGAQRTGKRKAEGFRVFAESGFGSLPDPAAALPCRSQGGDAAETARVTVGI